MSGELSGNLRQFCIVDVGVEAAEVGLSMMSSWQWWTTIEKTMTFSPGEGVSRLERCASSRSFLWKKEWENWLTGGEEFVKVAIVALFMEDEEKLKSDEWPLVMRFCRERSRCLHASV
jgi:hypothetical protein